VKQREPDGLLELGVPFDLDVGTVPEVVEVRALACGEAVPAAAQDAGQRCPGLVPHRRQRALARPSVGEELDQSQ